MILVLVGAGRNLSSVMGSWLEFAVWVITVCCKDAGSPLAGRVMASTPLPFRGQTACGLKPPLHLSPGASGEFGSHANRPRSGHRMQVMTFLRSTALETSSRRRSGSCKSCRTLNCHPGESRDPVSLGFFPNKQLRISNANSWPSTFHSQHPSNSNLSPAFNWAMRKQASRSRTARICSC